MVSMHGHFEGQKAGWFVFTTEWCPGCSSWIPQVVGAEQQAGERGLKVAYILGENRQYAKPTLNQCKHMRCATRYQRIVCSSTMTIRSFRWTFAKLTPYVEQVVRWTPFVGYQCGDKRICLRRSWSKQSD